MCTNIYIHTTCLYTPSQHACMDNPVQNVLLAIYKLKRVWFCLSIAVTTIYTTMPTLIYSSKCLCSFECAYHVQLRTGYIVTIFNESSYSVSSGYFYIQLVRAVRFLWLWEQSWCCLHNRGADVYLPKSWLCNMIKICT